METFGQVIENVLVKYGRGIVEEQFILNRITQAAFDTYTMAIVLSRATMSLNKNLPSAEHELLMAETWCMEVYIYIILYFNRIKNCHLNYLLIIFHSFHSSSYIVFLI